ncbi:BolA family protein [Amphiplicatus metriothermophilus]|uniref:Transcriptional regulator, BolA protein family n=1 Tax=Amphiplicatus metriothermophilus TaxID=1519374 RepID=A0A239PYN7_9PROT|nr:BolA family protein [Amphiplicatus metriothermophilus]MBB5519877.1 BolA protein [Amphiplicatus metriothermophilus]SNT75072.1 transcriptional regulator, BolA protein family [Amphiplicatus metriothermophilus]
MAVAETIREKLAAAFSPARLEVRDESHLHKGHAGARPGGESHFRILIVADAFQGMSRLARQRAVNAALKDELAGPVHALAMTALTPAEAGETGQ